MRIGQVIGKTTMSRQDPAFNGARWLMVNPVDAAHFNTAEHKIFDHLVVGLAGDGCLQEGISQEAASFAGRFGLDNLIMLYDSNDVTLDALASKTQNEDTAKRYEAANWEVFTVKQGNELKQYQSSGQIGEGQGMKAGVAYRMKDGSMVYVPETTPPADAAAQLSSP